MKINRIELKSNKEDLDSIFLLITKELQRAENKHPLWPDDVVHSAGIMAEECGESQQAANQLYWEGGDREKLIREIVQTGAMAVRFLLYLAKKEASDGAEV